MSVALGGSVVLASFVKVEKSAKEMLGGDVFYSEPTLGVLGHTWEDNIRMSLYAVGQEGMDRIWLSEVL